MTRIVTREEIVGQSLLKCYQTKEIYSSEYEITHASLLFSLKNGLLIDLTESINLDQQTIDVDEAEVLKTKKTSQECFEEAWGKKIVALALSDCFPTPIVLLSNNIIISIGSPSPFWVGPICENYDFEIHDTLFDFWNRTPIKL